MKKYIHLLFRKLGYRVVTINEFQNEDEVIYDNQIEAKRNIEVVRKSTMASDECLITLWQQAKYLEVNNIAGDYVECGVWKGGCVGLMALNSKLFGSSERQLFLFDSFQDICEPDKDVDGEKAISQANQWSYGGVDGKLKPLTGFYDSFGGHGTLDECRNLLENVIKYDKDKISYCVGWFQDTFKEHKNSIDKIALLRLDADWYSGTMICLETWYDKVVEGGIIIIDDYGTYEGCKKAVDEFFSNRRKPLLNHINKHSRYIIK